MKKNENFSKKQEDIPPQELNNDSKKINSSKEDLVMNSKDIDNFNKEGVSKSQSKTNLKPDVFDDILEKITESKYYDKVIKSLIGILVLSTIFFYTPICTYFLLSKQINYCIYLIALLVVFSVFFFINSKTKSNFIRVITLFFTLLIIKYTATTDATGIQPYVYIAILISINIFNFYTQIKNTKFLFWITILNYCIYVGLISSNILSVSSLLIYALFSIILNWLIYVILCKNNSNMIKLIIIFLANSYLIEKFITNTENIFLKALAICIVIIVSTILYTLVKDDKLKIPLYLYILYVSIGFLYITHNNNIYSSISICILACISMFSIIKFDNILVKIVAGCFLWMGACTLIINDYILITLTCLLILSGIVWYVSKDKKNNKFIVFCKHTIFSIFTFVSIDSFPFNSKYNMYIGVIIAIIYVLKLTNIERLKHDRYKKSNKFILILFFIISTIYSTICIENLIISFVLSTLILLLLTNSKYTNDGFIKRHILVIYLLYFTYIIHSFCIMVLPDYAIAYLISNILLIIFAFVIILKGYKIKNKEVKYYGLLLLTVILYRLLFISLYFYKLSVKIVLLGVILIPLLTIILKENRLKQKINNIDNVENNINTSTNENTKED